MKRILFVDDDPQVFAEVQPMLAPHSDDLEVSFAPDADTALLLLSTAPFDVIIADLRMPTVDGPSLLKSVSEKWPGIVAHYSFRTGGDGGFAARDPGGTSMPDEALRSGNAENGHRSRDAPFGTPEQQASRESSGIGSGFAGNAARISGTARGFRIPTIR